MEPCKHREFCGGCLHQGRTYDYQLKWKQGEIKGFMKEYDVSCPDVRSIEGCPSEYRYRNKMEYTFGDLEKGGEMTLGMHQKKRFMSIMTVDECQIVPEDFNIILRTTLNFCIANGYKKYHKKDHKGLMRHLIVRKGIRTNEVLINIVTSSESPFDEDGYKRVLMNENLDSRIVGILHTINDGIADKVSCDELRILYGRDYYMEKIMRLEFKVSAFSFFQTNVEAAERLYGEALDLIDDPDGKEVMDLYCGAGTITQMLALKAKHVTGIEIIEDAVEAARHNAQLNGLKNCDFIAGDVLDILSGINEGIIDNVTPPDVIVVDPPRVGINPKALGLIARYGVKQLLYISCQPKTLCRDIKFLEPYGYRPMIIKPFDNFPMTRHVEALTLLAKC